MRKVILLAILFIALSNYCFAQDNEIPRNKKEFSSKAGIKAGYNINKLAGEKSPNVNFDNKSGFMVGGFFSPSSKSGFGYRTELVFSRQGFSYDDGGIRQDVQTDYIYAPQLSTFTIGNFLQLQAGAQIGYLLKSSLKSESASSEEEKVTEFMNRFDTGAAFGFELYPLRRLIIGSRYNLSFGKLYEQSMTAPSPSPFPFDPTKVKGRNAVLQFFAGVRL
ncbi:MAG: outer membrane beta-barrel protein [Chitinophagaceae bacterium]